MVAGAEIGSKARDLGFNAHLGPWVTQGKELKLIALHKSVITQLKKLTRRLEPAQGAAWGKKKTPILSRKLICTMRLKHKFMPSKVIC